MTVDLLSQRLKAAKRELTNLKTAHMRGLGLLKVYTHQGVAPVPTDDTYDFTLRVDFERGFGEKPLALFSLVTVAPTEWFFNNNLEAEDEYYSSDGYTLIIRGIRIAFAEWSDGYKIVSTAPVSNLTWEWSLHE
jgi:hypothetical protein